MAIVDLFFGWFSAVFALANATGWLVAPVVLGFVAWRLWLFYINTEFLMKVKWVMLEVRLPQEIRRSPLAMEIVLNSLHQTGGTGTWFQKYWLGNLRQYFSLEVVSIEGAVHFLIRTPVQFRNVVESYIYAQYPEVEIVEVPDYVDRVTYGKDGRWSMMGGEFAFTKADPYPIKTYIDYGVDRNLKEEEKIDPITTMIELMGSLQKGEQMWLQIMVRASQKDAKSWVKASREEIKKYKEDALKEAGGDKEEFQETKLTKGQREVIAALERHSEKLIFDTGVRAIYIAEKDAFRGPNVPAMLGMLKQYNSNTLNGFRPARVTSPDNPWEEYFGLHGFVPYINSGMTESEKMKRKMFALYRNRTYFYGIHRRKPLVMTSEELATVYHFPGGVSQTPSFGRIESKKAEPPVNLPI